MKSNDVAVILVVMFVGGIVSFFLSGLLFASGAASQQKSAVVDPITAQFLSPDERYFNSSSIDPTQPIEIGDSTNQNPFEAAQ